MYIDYGWPIYDFDSVKGKICVTQIGANLSNDKSHRLVLPSGRHTNNHKFLIRTKHFLAQVDIVFIGGVIENDISNLKKDY